MAALGDRGVVVALSGDQDPMRGVVDDTDLDKGDRFQHLAGQLDRVVPLAPDVPRFVALLIKDAGSERVENTVDAFSLGAGRPGLVKLHGDRRFVLLHNLDCVLERYIGDPVFLDEGDVSGAGRLVLCKRGRIGRTACGWRLGGLGCGWLRR